MNRYNSQLRSHIYLGEIVLIACYPMLSLMLVTNRVSRVLTNQFIAYFIYIFSFVLISILIKRYEHFQTRKWHEMIFEILFLNFIHFMIVSFFLIYIEKDLSRLNLFMFHSALSMLLIIYFTFAEWGHHVIKFGKSRPLRIGIINYGSHAEKYVATITQNERFNQSIEFTMSPNASLDYNELHRMLSQYQVDIVVISDQSMSNDWLEKVIGICDTYGQVTSYLPYAQTFLSVNTIQHIFGDLIISDVHHVPLDFFINRIVKRSMDIVISLIAIIVLSPLFLFILCGVKLSSSGPILYVQTRIGLHQKPFKMVKFRSMVMSTHESWVGANDPRITPFGRFLRWSSLDELPQLFNILLGDMSLIGPRPEREIYVSEFSKIIDKYQLKHLVKPGLTGLAQINGYRGDTSLSRRIELDIYYIENWSIFLDIYIIFRTILFGFINRQEA
jgi:exopolysaccharide biosynthesis polyprenyl glycosylphosphotransferase